MPNAMETSLPLEELHQISQSIVNAAKLDDKESIRTLLLKAAKHTYTIAIPLPARRGSKPHQKGKKNCDFQIFRRRIINVCKSIGGIKTIRIQFWESSEFVQFQQHTQMHAVKEHPKKRSKHFRKSGKNTHSDKYHALSAIPEVGDKMWSIQAWKDCHIYLKQLHASGRITENHWQRFLWQYRCAVENTNFVYRCLIQRKPTEPISRLEAAYKKMTCWLKKSNFNYEDVFNALSELEAAKIHTKHSVRRHKTKQLIL